MTTARSQLICPDITPYYHCVSRCVRRSYLCGKDQISGQSYEHRREWVEQRLLRLASIYCIRICSYAVMSNHYHLVVYIDTNAAESLSDEEVIARWGTEHELPGIMKRFVGGESSGQPDSDKCQTLIQTWRTRLSSVSWFMKELNFTIAVQANKEDQCTGHFWEGRFKSQALLDEKAVLAAMAYVDLNPVRAKQAETPEQSLHTSVRLRIKKLKHSNINAAPLADFVGYKNPGRTHGLPFRLIDYLQLLDWLGRQVREDKCGRIAKHQPEILQRLSLSAKECIRLCTRLETRSRVWIGETHNLRLAKVKLRRKRMIGIHIS